MYALHNAVPLWLLQFGNSVILSYNNLVNTSVTCTGASLVLHCDQFDHDLRQLKLDPVDLVVENYDITLSWPLWCNCEGILRSTIHSATPTGVTHNARAAEYP